MTDEPVAQPTNTEIRLELPSRLELLSIIDKVVNGVADQLAFEDDDKDAIAISVIEAGTNAIQHGHKHDPNKIVRITFHLHPDELEVEVEDEGRGFDLELLEDASAPENLLRERGRGIFIMRSMMDEVRFDFHPEGTVCRLIKRRRTTPLPEPASGPGELLDDLT